MSPPRQLPSPVLCLGIAQWQINENLWFYGNGIQRHWITFFQSHISKGHGVNFKSVFLWSLRILLTAPHMNLIQGVLFSEKEHIFKTQINNRMIGILFFVTATLCSMVILDKQGLGTSNLVKQWQGGTDWALSPTLGFVAHSVSEADTQKIVPDKKWGARAGRLWPLWVKCMQGKEAIINIWKIFQYIIIFKIFQYIIEIYSIFNYIQYWNIFKIFKIFHILLIYERLHERWYWLKLE